MFRECAFITALRQMVSLTLNANEYGVMVHTNTSTLAVATKMPQRILHATTATMRAQFRL
jgi:hypothetical protein